MKKIFTIIALLALTMTAGAKDFTDQLAISLGSGEPTITEATISVEDIEGSDGLYKIILKEFSFQGMNIGDVNIEDVKGNSTVGDNGYIYFEETTKEATITNGGSIAAMLGNKVTVTIKEGSCMNDDKLYLVINLPVSIMGSTINVDATFGTAPSTAKSYTDNMVVDFGEGPSDPITATINVEKQENGKYTLQLRNFKFELAPGYALGIGHITINDVEGTDADGITVLSVKEQPVTITPGDDESIDWSMGEQLAQAGLKATINGEMTDSKLYAVIQLPLANVTVTFGEKISTGISSTTTSSNSGVEAIYDINGNKLNNMKKGLNILKKADGTTVKVIKK